MLFFAGPDALAAYLLDLGYTHPAFSPRPLDPRLDSSGNWTEAPAAKPGTVSRSRDVVVVDLRRARDD
jgi:hypothetical protein